jgi:hypothetical protein
MSTNETITPQNFVLETVAIETLKPHPRNYREHPEDQLLHLVESIKRHGLYRNVVTSNDGTVLAWHGVVLACKKMGMKQIPIVRLSIPSDDPAALKVLTGDNEISHLGEINDRTLTEILKDIKDFDITGLLGTGYDEAMLANLVMISRPESEIADKNQAAQWVGLPGYEEGSKVIQVQVSFETEADRESFVTELGIKNIKRAGKTWSVWWPDKERDDPSSVLFEG